MKRINAIITHPVYQAYYKRLEELEQNRPFCRHQMTHLMDVARIAYIRSLERGLPLDKEVIYAAAVLHDIGKSLQYEKKIPHEIASVEIAEKILCSLPPKVVFSAEEIRVILTAVRGHRMLREDAEPLEQLLYENDKASRMCFSCPTEADCNWSREKKNMEIMI